jgi:hypothetical protein
MCFRSGCNPFHEVGAVLPMSKAVTVACDHDGIKLDKVRFNAHESTES